MGKQRTPEGGGGIVDRKMYHCNVCNVDLYDGTSPQTRHDKSTRHKAIALAGLDYDRCPRCDVSVSKNSDGGSALSDHLKNR